MIANCIVLLSAALALSPSTGRTDGLPAVGVARHVLAVGADDGGPRRTRLRYAKTDAKQVAGVFRQFGGTAPENASTVMDPGRDDLLAALRRLAERVRTDATEGLRTEAIVYYSGHSDETGLHLSADHLPYRDFLDAVRAVPADVSLVILDSCASGVLTTLKGGSFLAPLSIDSSQRVSGSAILTSASSDESAQESSRIGASFFTHALLTGLRGGADLSGDHLVTLDEAYDFARQETLRSTVGTSAGGQHPAYDIRLNGTGDLVLTDLRRMNAGIVIPDSLAGRVLVWDSDDRLAAEFRKPNGATVEVALEAGRYIVNMEFGETMLEAKINVAAGDHTNLADVRFRSVPREKVLARGTRRLIVPYRLTALVSRGRFRMKTLNTDYIEGFADGEGINIDPIEDGTSITFLVDRRRDGPLSLHVGYTRVVEKRTSPYDVRTADPQTGIATATPGTYRLTTTLNGLEVQTKWHRNIAGGDVWLGTGGIVAYTEADILIQVAPVYPDDRDVASYGYDAFAFGFTGQVGFDLPVARTLSATSFVGYRNLKSRHLKSWANSSWEIEGESIDLDFTGVYAGVGFTFGPRWLR